MHSSHPSVHTLVGVALNVLVLGLIAYGFHQSEEWRWAWALVAVPIIIVTLSYARHLIRNRRYRSKR